MKAHRRTKNELLVVAALGTPLPVLPFRPLRVVYQLADDSNTVLWPTFDEPFNFIVEGELTSRQVLEQQIEQGAALRLPEPFQRAAVNRVVVFGDAGTEFITPSEQFYRQREAVIRYITQAIEAARSGKVDAAVQAATEAYLTDPQHPVPALIRAAVLVVFADLHPELREEQDSALDDLLALLRGDNAPESLLADILFRRINIEPDWIDRTKLALERRRPKPQVVLAPPAPAHTALLAAYLLQEEFSMQSPARLSMQEIQALSRGETAIIGKLASPGLRIAVTEQPASYMGVVAKTRTGSISLVKAHLAELSAHAQTVNTLETTMLRRERHGAWEAFLAKTALYGQYSTPYPWDEGMQLANDLRTALNLRGSIEDVYGVLTNLVGVALFPIDFGVPNVDAVGLLPPAAPPCVYINYAGEAHNSQIVVRRFTLAHEIAHFVFDRHTAPSVEAVCQTYEMNTTDRTEQRANSFAAYFLAPKDAVQREVKDLDLEGNDAVREGTLRIAGKFGISLEAATRHIFNCHREDGLEMPQAQAFRDLLNKVKAEAGRQCLNLNEEWRSRESPIDGAPLVPAEDQEAPRLERRGQFLRLVLQCVSTARLSAAEAAGILGVDEAWVSAKSLSQ